MIFDFRDYPNYIFGTINSNLENYSFSRLIAPQIPDLRYSAGIIIRFKTDAKSIKIKYSLLRKVVQPHIGATLTNGLFFAVYKENSSELITRGCCITRSNEEWFAILNQNTNKFCDIQLYLPSFNEITDLFVDLGESNNLLESKNNFLSQIVFCGGPMTLGSGCLFAAADFAHITARKLNSLAYNLGLNKNDFLDLRIAKAICGLNPDLIVLEAFGVWTSVEHIKNNFRLYIESILSSIERTPIIILNQPYLGEWNGGYLEKEKIVREAVIELNHAYPNRIFLLDGRKLFAGIDLDR
ncbi:MAG: SGNH/GDSL hydrolase family protein, partial [Clostridia bacterium]|nr:SGNH/GDSL hydrolase family protein [Clostridia bacterium]